MPYDLAQAVAEGAIPHVTRGELVHSVGKGLTGMVLVGTDEAVCNIFAHIGLHVLRYDYCTRRKAFIRDMGRDELLILATLAPTP